MAIEKEFQGWNPDGTPHVHYKSDGHVVLTGPIRGQVQLENGTVYDVTEPVIEVDPNHADEVAHRIGLRYEAEGHPDHGNIHPPGHDEYVPFKYTPSGVYAKKGKK